MNLPIRAVLLLFVLLAAAPAAAGDGLVWRDRSYGPSQRISGVYFSNWENSVITACPPKADSCAPPADTEREWLECAPEACAELERRITALGGDMQTGVQVFVTFEGRRALKRKAKTYLHDTESRLYAERILSVAPLRD
jgi:hypothetical protein